LRVLVRRHLHLREPRELRLGVAQFLRERVVLVARLRGRTLAHAELLPHRRFALLRTGHG
jgi:hypothetical protein